LPAGDVSFSHTAGKSGATFIVREVSMSASIHRLTGVALGATFAVALAATASAQLIPRKDLSASMGATIVQTAVETCKAKGYNVSAVVVDRAGETLAALRGDNTGPHTLENARRKAYTARTFRMPTEEFVKLMETQPVRRQQITLPHVIAIGGGVPIKVGDEVIGGAGVSGAPGGQDEPCVQAGIDKVKHHLQ